MVGRADGGDVVEVERVAVDVEMVAVEDAVAVAAEQAGDGAAVNVARACLCAKLPPGGGGVEVGVHLAPLEVCPPARTANRAVSEPSQVPPQPLSRRLRASELPGQVLGRPKRQNGNQRLACPWIVRG